MPTAGRDRRRAGASPLSQVLGPFTRTGGFYARSWGAYLDREPGELPVARPTIALAAEAFLDEIVLTGFRLLRSAPDATRLDRITREVIAALEFYGQQGWLERSGGACSTPAADRRNGQDCRTTWGAPTSACSSTVAMSPMPVNRGGNAG